MKSLLGILSTLGVMGFGFWAYSENYATQAAIKESRKLRHELIQARADLEILRDEWAYLNRPDRLHLLVQLNSERLGLFAMGAQNFGTYDQVAYPAVLTPLPGLEPGGDEAHLASVTPERQP